MYITATTQNWSKKRFMQYLFPLFNYTSYKNKTSICHLSCSLPAEGTLNPSSDPSSLAHPSPEVHQWLGRRAEHFEHCITWGSRSQQWDHNPWGAIPASQVLQATVGKWWSGDRAAGVAGKAVPRGRMVPASPGAVASPWLSWTECGCRLLLTPCESSCLPRSAAPASRMLSQSARGAAAGAALAQGAQIPRLCVWPCWAWEPKLVPQSMAGPWLGHRSPATLLLGLCSSAFRCPASKVYGEQKQDRRQIYAKGDGSTFSSWSLEVSKLGERLNWFKIQYAAVWKCIVCMYTFIYKDQMEVLCYVVYSPSAFNKNVSWQSYRMSVKHTAWELMVAEWHFPNRELTFLFAFLG